MKLHYSSCPISVATNRKLKSVIAATDSKVEEVTYKGGDDISKLSAFNTLPLLETPEGTIFSSNAIARYLASTNKKELYGNGNIYCQGLIDQFLDFATFELEPAVRGVSKHQHG
jgi:elongation factor 1-gamma